MTTTRPWDEFADFVRLLRDELGLEMSEQQAAADFDALPTWDSVHLLRLVTLIERETGRRVPVARVLQARSLREVHALTRPDRKDLP